MILPFKTQFVEPILNGSKIHTIRADRGKRWQPGCTIQMATGVRTKAYKCFHTATCTRVQEIVIDFAVPVGFEVYIDARRLSLPEIETLAERDGFTGEFPMMRVLGFVDFFIYQADENEKFTGRLIHWTDTNY
jgi:hypothetical protein